MFITLQWDANQEPDLNHYVVYWGTSLGSYSDNSGNIDKSETTYTVTGLSGGTTYYLAVKAYDDQGRESDYSNEVSAGAIATSEGGNGGCFIATAAYGSPMSSKVEILCQFRDRYLKSNILGKSLIALYERSYPYLANRISKKMNTLRLLFDTGNQCYIKGLEIPPVRKLVKNPSKIGLPSTLAS